MHWHSVVTYQKYYIVFNTYMSVSRRFQLRREIVCNNLMLTKAVWSVKAYPCNWPKCSLRTL